MSPVMLALDIVKLILLLIILAIATYCIFRKRSERQDEIVKKTIGMTALMLISRATEYNHDRDEALNWAMKIAADAIQEISTGEELKDGRP